jgi:pimeloyl-ACP methyl ester carboxylesterase
VPAAGLLGVAMRILPFASSRTGRRPGIPALVAVGLLVSVLGLPAAAGDRATSGGGAAVPTLAWTACGDEAPGFECATAQVPLDYDRPRGARITLALTRLPASDPARRIGSIFFNPGGPGGSGVDFLQAVGPFLYSDEVRARFDLVSFDPRGVARSTPLQCFDTTDEALAALAPFPFPVTRAEERVWVQADRTWARACAERGGPILDHMSTANVARDMDLLRRAVGDRKMTYVGYSYGTAIGSTYANLFPDKVRAVVIDGVIDPVSYTTGRGDQAETLPSDARLRSEQGAYDTLQAFLRLCDQGGPNCAFSDGNPKRRYDRLARRLLREPAQLPDGEGGTVPFTYADLVATTLGAMYDPTSWPGLAEFLQELDTLTSEARAADRLRALRSHLGLRAPAPYEQVLEGFAGVWCLDPDNPDHPSAWARAARRADRRDPYFGRPWIWFGSICAQWPGKDRDRYVGPFNRRTANTVLVVGNVNDPATRYQDAVSTARLLGRGRLLTVAGSGHTSLFLSSCADRLVSRYLLTGRVPPKGTVCDVDVVPFAEPAALAQSAQASAHAYLMPPTLAQAQRD